MKKLLLTFCMAVFCVFTAAAQKSNDSIVAEEPSFDNPVIKAIMNRRSIRKYLDKPVEHEKLAVIAECGINAPSSGNKQPWLLRVVEDQELLAEINQVYVKVNAQQIRRDKNFKNMFRNAPNIIVVCSPRKGDGEEEAGMLAENMMLAAHSLGLGTCCLGGIVRFLSSNNQAEFFLDELNIPVDYKINFIIAIGYPDEEPAAKLRDTSKIMYIE
jgi:nitroreductase